MNLVYVLKLGEEALVYDYRLDYDDSQRESHSVPDMPSR